MRAATDVEAFVHNPVGAFISGATWLLCCPAATLMALVSWGSPSREDCEHVMDTFDADLLIGPHSYFIDARRMAQQPDPVAFAAVVGRMGPQWERYRTHVTRCAIALPPGMTAAVVIGFFTLAPPPFETRFFTEPIEALRWVGATDPVWIQTTLDALQERACGASSFLLRMRAVLDGDVAQTSIENLAQGLNMSIRTLQRHLAAAGTSYRKELSAARVRKAQRLLVGTDLKITAVALEVGCASSQHLSTLFRKSTGESPSEWRSAHCTRRAG